MAPWVWAVIIVVIALVVIGAVLFDQRRRRTQELRRRFGPEYERTLESTDGRGAAEAELNQRARRRSQLTIVPLPEPVRLRYAQQWRGVQEQFVDRPSEAVAAAEDLLTQVMRDRGYPVSDFEEQAGLISVDHPHVVENYRVAHRIRQQQETHQASTEDLREAMVRYRSLFDELLRPDSPERTEDLPQEQR